MKANTNCLPLGWVMFITLLHYDPHLHKMKAEPSQTLTSHEQTNMFKHMLTKHEQTHIMSKQICSNICKQKHDQTNLFKSNVCKQT